MIASFPPAVSDSCRTLVLGTMPGVESLRQQQYYAHPRNAFWKIMGAIFNFDSKLPYCERLKLLNSHGVALWDTVKFCERKGSLDSDIKCPEFNDFTWLFNEYPSIREVCLNGKGAEKFFRQFQSANSLPELHITVLPSTSPAYASMRYADKLAQWRKILTNNGCIQAHTGL